MKREPLKDKLFFVLAPVILIVLDFLMAATFAGHPFKPFKERYRGFRKESKSAMDRWKTRRESNKQKYNHEHQCH